MNYMELLDKYHPEIVASCDGDPLVYENIIFQGDSISKEILDANLLDNSKIDLFYDFEIPQLRLISIKDLSAATGLDRTPWGFSRGAKTERHYKDGEEVRIKVYYTYVYSDGERYIDSYEEWIEFYKLTGEMFLQIKVPNSDNMKSIKSVNRDIRQGRIDYLEAGAENLRDAAELMAEPYKSQYIQVADSIEFIFTFYSLQIDQYIQRGTLAFENAVNTEVDAGMLSIFAIPVRAPDVEFPNGLTVKQSIIHQLTGVKP